MNTLLFAASAVIITLGHFLRTKRWKSFISVYEDVDDSNLIRSMSFGYFTDLLIPFHAGDLVRATYMGKRLKNKTAFAFSTIIIDRLLDVFIVALLYLGFFLFKSRDCLGDLIIYTAGVVILTSLLIWSMSFRRSLKRAVLSVSSVFNENIQLWILCFVWSCISTVKNIMHKISKPILLLQTTGMWICYMLSYYLFSAASDSMDILDVFNAMFSASSATTAAYDLKSALITDSNFPYFFLFELITCLVLFITSVIPALRNKGHKRSAELIIPYTNANSRLDFLKIYFSDVRERSYINAFLNINKNVTILRNCSAGSNATTLMCIKNDDMIFRKYAFGNDGDKLYDQVRWLRENKDRINVTEITDVEKQEKFCWYDMPYRSSSVGFFDYIHSAPEDNSWHILHSVINDLERNYSSHQYANADSETIGKYLDSKVFKNLKAITSALCLHHLMSYDNIVINGRSYRNLPQFIDRLSDKQFWTNIFLGDYYSDIHGDLTIENIICDSETTGGYYLIDPNGGNIHNSPNLDYAKLLQSLHGGYEFLMHTPKVSISGNHISFHMTRSTAYDTLYRHFREYLYSSFSKERVRSIYFHEIIHWFRLMPYKINNDTERAPMFYAGMIMIINDIFEEFSDDESDK